MLAGLGFELAHEVFEGNQHDGQSLLRIIDTLSRLGQAQQRILSTHCYSTIILPTVDGTVHHIRKPGTPDAAQEQVYGCFDSAVSVSSLTMANGGKRRYGLPVRLGRVSSTCLASGCVRRHFGQRGW